jgi:hypothetical protein
MIDALVAGRLYGASQSRMAKNGSAYVTAEVRAATGSDGTLFVNVIDFSAPVVAALLALSDGESAAPAGVLRQLPALQAPR